MKVTSRTRKYDRVFDIKGLSEKEILTLAEILNNSVSITTNEIETRKKLQEKIYKFFLN